MRRLQPYVRDSRAGYDQSLAVLRHAKVAKEGLYTKTSIMLGLGETHDEVRPDQSGPNTRFSAAIPISSERVPTL